MRSIFQCPCLALSATATPPIYHDVKKALHLQDCEVKAYPPDRSNIFIELARRGSLVPDRDLAWIVSGLRAMGQQFPKTMIYGRSINCITELYAWLLGCLQGDVFVDSDNGKQRMVAVYHRTRTPLRGATAIYHGRVQEARLCHPCCRIHGRLRHWR